ncbi:inhibitor of nuclear factor kappa-B kinase subunit epsilon isoform X1 [Sparus aurata]|uniref:Inhibitor of nuclear factor kappa B kinase subunit epsilon n=2 Tax=Sparus aurata TaxID=8175 RepID=A0A671UKI1_SPAAU|nr:inhibitor of nuclear factor kappa-B kinase subunit epsilon-like isoform X1 [Sparus aurata]XP_030275173.1 inhibitor of nuclear factor kappa-B kinase subunit epsilon-like isoform X1 [Sparus aurata]XP_030275174.1 inhibitor of nuclear factor kappa-B kinase subunit epsilon-like isoform X1 [Sparus aurata]XP_030275175.1 inhibitor of nuclear factor kappa-B kinase subunit epsilon-like isoform X1 [Sparus aurata]
MSGITASTTNYLWSLQDVLGQGATASVYKARNKKSGELVAVKVFNMMSYNRPHDVQMREFEMLRKLNHSNIVKLYAVEELPSKQKVLVMEYCSGGSLLSLLEEPENAFGLPETEFLTVLQCVVQGMNHLRENGVVHRDIKPGNIMRQVGEDGKSVYKLTDFGAARELEDDEKFVSIYGTEEYLHPDMYERAVLRKPHQKSYGVSVDLWSIGVTFYHAATGSLPFIPYGGPRRNKPTMFKITTEKPMGAIAGIQRVLDGPIEWSYQLPHSCQLSQGLTVQLVPVLEGILEADQERCWGFDQFFTATTDILQRQPVHLFSLQQAMAHCIYIHHYNTVSAFFEEVASQTGIGVQLQHLLYLGHDLPLEGSMKVVNLPSTSPARPLMLLSFGLEANTSLPFREPETPVIPSRFEVLADYNFSKVIVGVVHQYLRIVRLLHTHRELLLQGYYSYMMRLRKECGEAMHSIAMITIRLQSCLSVEHRIHTLGHFASENQGSADSTQKLQLVHEHLPIYASGIQEFQNRLDHLQIEQAKLAETLANDKSCQKMEMLLQKITAIHQHYRKDRLTGKLAYNDEQIHKFEKIHLSGHIKRVKSLFREDCVQRYKEILASTRMWSSVLLEMQTRLQDFSSFSTGLLADLEMSEQCQNKTLDKILFSVRSTKSGQQPGISPTDKDQMVSRMHRLKEEMEILVRELQCNNGIIESLGAVNPAAALEPSLARPSTL